jgi:alpha-glucosidase
MARSAYEALRHARPDERPFVLTRSAYAGVQRYSAVWLGDNKSWFEHLRLSIPMLLNLGLSGLAFAGADVGGFGGDADGELLVRWYQTGIFYPFLRNHCALDRRPQEPWSFGTRVERAVRKLLVARYRFLPYLEALFYEHRATGAPIMRPLSWHYPDDERCFGIDDQFMWGQEVLVAPIVVRGCTGRPVYLPAGRWYPWEGGEPLRGPGWHSVAWPFDAVPAFVREGAILPLFARLEHTDQAPGADVTFRCFGRRARGVYWEDDGQSFGYERGEYAEYALSYQQGRFRADCRHPGYRVQGRRYYYEAEGRRRKLGRL